MYVIELLIVFGIFITPAIIELVSLLMCMMYKHICQEVAGDELKCRTAVVSTEEESLF